MFDPKTFSAAVAADITGLEATLFPHQKFRRISGWYRAI